MEEAVEDMQADIKAVQEEMETQFKAKVGKEVDVKSVEEMEGETEAVVENVEVEKMNLET